MKKLTILIIFAFTIQLSNAQNDLKVYYTENLSAKFFNEYKLSNINDNSFLNSNGSKKSVPLAVGLSLILPGMGELYVGDYRIGRYLTGAEVTLWLTFASLNYYGNWIKNDARSFAAVNANVDISGKDDKFFVNIGNYLDVYQYNEKKLQERKDEQIYDPNSAYYWKWNSEVNRMKYRNLRIKSDDVLNSTQFVLGAILANHIISAVNAGRLAIRFNSQESHVFQINTNVKGTTENPLVMLTISKIF